MDKSRTEILVGKDNLEKFANKNIAIIGVGGVGGQVAITLARCGIENLTIIDFDKVDSSNINRQVVAWQTTIGKNKVEVLKEMILAINPNAKVSAICERIDKDNLSKLISKNFDIVVDAIDSVQDKIELICYCKENNINIISAMGAGNRIDLPSFYVMDIYKTHDDGLAKVMRKKLRERNIKNLDVVCSVSKPIVTSGVVGSIAYYPAMCGLVICAYIINKIIKEGI